MWSIDYRLPFLAQNTEDSVTLEKISKYPVTRMLPPTQFWHILLYLILSQLYLIVSYLNQFPPLYFRF
jgi:hypothetical protein